MKNFTAVVVMAIAMFAQTACVRLGQYGSRPAEIRLYADSCEGDDHFSGVTPGRAKRTIQAAWDALPNVLQTTATIHLAPGIYRQSLNAAGKVCAGGAEIVIEGDAQDPGRVRVTGADVENDNLMRENGFTFTAQGGVTLKGISFDHYSNNAIRLLYGSMITVNKCVVHDTLSPGVCLSWQSHVTINDSEIYSNHGACPIYIQCNSSGYVRHCYIHDNFGDRGFSYGASALCNSSITFEVCRFERMHRACEALAAGVVSFNVNLAPTTITDCDYAIHIDGNGTSQAGGSCVLTNVGSRYELGSSDPTVY